MATRLRLIAQRARERFVRAYLGADLRSLAAGRIAMALVLLFDLVNRWVQIGTWYTNEGLIPNHTLLWRPSFEKVFSFFYMASYTHEAVAGFVICAIAYTTLLVGFRTKLAQVASMICVLSLHGRLLLFDNGGDVVLGLLCVWTTFLPTGRFWSVDAVLARRDPPVAPGTAPASQPPVTVTGAGDPSVRSLGVLALTFQLAFIYLFNAVHKGGATWRDGTAVNYVLHLDRLVTWFGVWLRHRMTPGLSHALTWSSLVIEWSLPPLLLSPFLVRHCRRLAIVLIVMLHSGFGVCLNLGNFVPAMIVYTPNFIPGEDWDALGRWWARSPRRVRWSTRLRTRAVSIIERAAALLTPGRYVRVTDPGPVARALVRRLPAAREITVGLFIVVAANQLLDENYAAHFVIDHHNSPEMAAAVTYLNLFQGWSMFAPDAPTSDLNIAVDAVTSDGRHVDPFNEIANPRTPAPGLQIPTAMGPSWLFYGYENRIPDRPEYWQALHEWILRYPNRTGRTQDKIVSFKVFKVEDDSPPVGEQTPRNRRWTRMFQFP
ncbi:MAG TPA: HTTM domain-containing protein [Polyangia bacterium]|nr:HTTM domain-containing protein [Polyangia bacterium]